jgi:hypothetical protein
MKAFDLLSAPSINVKTVPGDVGVIGFGSTTRRVHKDSVPPSLVNL